MRIRILFIIILDVFAVNHKIVAESEKESLINFGFNREAIKAYNQLMKRAFRHFKKDPKEALMYLDEAIRIFPDIPNAYIAKSKTLLSVSRNHEAMSNVENAIKLYNNVNIQSEDIKPEFREYSVLSLEELYETLAVIRYQFADYDVPNKDLITWRVLKWLAPKDLLNVRTIPASEILFRSRCFYMYGVAGLAEGVWQRQASEVFQLRRVFNSVVRLSNSSLEQAASLFASGTLFARIGDIQTAYISFELAVLKHPSWFEALMRSGEFRSRLGMHKKAQMAYEKASQLRPSDSDAHIQVGNSLRRQGRFEDAINKYSQVYDSKDSSKAEKSEAKYQIGSVFEAKRLQSSAEVAYRDAIRQHPSHARSLNNLASILISQRGLSDEATSLYQSAVRADPHMFEAYNNLGGNLLQSGRADEAVTYLEFALKLEKNEAQIYFNLGLAYRKSSADQQKKSVSHLRTALRMNPSNKDYYWELARTYNYLGQNDFMLAVLEAMTKTLRNGWGTSLPPGRGIESYIHENLHKTHADSRPLSGRVGLELNTNITKNHQRAVIIILCCGDDDELKDLHFSLRALHRHFVSSFRYPVVILHDKLNATDLSSLKAAFSSSAKLLSFEKIRLDFPRSMTAESISRIPKQLFLAGHSWGLGYRHMSNFFCDDFYYLDVFRDYEYYWRLDADSFLLHDVGFDVFAHMALHRKTYGYIVVTQEDPAVVEGLWTATQEYMDKGGIRPKSLFKHLNQSRAWNRDMFYTNFEISRFDFWRSSEYRRYLSALQETNGIYMHRWGDAPIHLLAVRLLLHDESLEIFENISYWHQYYVNLVREA